MKRIILSLLILCMLFLPFTSHAALKMTPSLKLNVASVTMEEGDLFLLTAFVSPIATPKWSSSNSNIASVDAKGCVTARKAGKTKITATVRGKKATCTVTVTKAVIQLNYTNITLKKGNSIRLKATSSLHSSSKIVWTATSSKVLTVDSRSGIVKAVGKGSGYIYASQEGHKARCKIVVN